MPPAATHDDDDLSLRRSKARSSSGQVALVALSVICGLVAFTLCVAAEVSRSEVSSSVGGSQQEQDQCFYSSSGRNALAYAVGAFILLAVSMFAEHAYMLVAVDAVPQSAAADDVASTLTCWHTCCLLFSFLTRCCLIILTWICFGIAEVLLMIGIGVESGHMSGDWRKPRPVCHRVRPGMFAAAGILGLITVAVGFVVYVTAVQVQRLLRLGQQQQHSAPDHQ